MTNEERRKAAEWFRKRAMECPMPATRQMYKIATEALEAPPNDNWEGYSSRLWKNAYERGKTDAEQRWIPVSERLPEEAYGCIVTVMDTNPMTFDEFENIYPDFVGWDGENWNDADGDSIPFEVIAWMPLPEPYKAESEDKLDGNPVDIDKAVEHYEGTLETLKGIDLEVDR